MTIITGILLADLRKFNIICLYIIFRMRNDATKFVQTMCSVTFPDKIVPLMRNCTITL